MAQRYGWRSGSTFPTSPMPIDLLLWTTHVAPQVHGSATIPLTTLQQHIGTETTAKKQSIYFLGLEIEGWLPAINAEFPGLRVTLMESALILAAIQRCDVAVYGADSAIDRRFSRLRNGSVIAGSR